MADGYGDYGEAGASGYDGGAAGAYDGGKHIGMAHVGYREISGLRIDFEDADEPRGRIVCVDGKIVRVERGGWVQVETMADSLLDLVHRPQ